MPRSTHPQGASGRVVFHSEVHSESHPELHSEPGVQEPISLQLSWRASEDDRSRVHAELVFPAPDRQPAGADPKPLPIVRTEQQEVTPTHPMSFVFGGERPATVGVIRLTKDEHPSSRTSEVDLHARLRIGESRVVDRVVGRWPEDLPGCPGKARFELPPTPGHSRPTCLELSWRCQGPKREEVEVRLEDETAVLDPETIHHTFRIRKEGREIVFTIRLELFLPGRNFGASAELRGGIEAPREMRERRLLAQWRLPELPPEAPAEEAHGEASPCTEGDSGEDEPGEAPSSETGSSKRRSSRKRRKKSSAKDEPTD